MNRPTLRDLTGRQALLVGTLIDRGSRTRVRCRYGSARGSPRLCFSSSSTRTTRTPPKRGIDLDRQALPRVVIHEVQGTKPPHRAERIGHEVHRPPLIGCHRLRQRLTHRAAIPSTFALQCQPFLYVQPCPSCGAFCSAFRTKGARLNLPRGHASILDRRFRWHPN